MIKKAVIVSCFDNYSYEVRTKYIEKVLRELGFKTVILAGDFDHRNKETYHTERDGLRMLHVPTYKRNLSFGRIYSHFVFGHKVRRVLGKIKPDVVYAITPPNFEFSAVSKYQKKGKTKVVYDVVDMWPETLPVTGLLKKLVSPALKIWAGLRDRALKSADGILFECNLFKDTIDAAMGGVLIDNGVKEKVVYFCKKDSMAGESYADAGLETIDKKADKNRVYKIVYLGAINNIVDIDLIGKILREISKHKNAELHIIGKGEEEDTLIKVAEDAGARVITHGIIYDESEKREVMQDADAALNIMKDTVYIGATMKSLDYFSLGIPVISSVRGDTEKLLESTGAGISVDKTDYKEMIKKFINMSESENDKMKAASRKLFLDTFEEDKIYNELKNFFSELTER